MIKKKRSKEEETNQISMISYFKSHRPHIVDFIIHIPNGGTRKIGEAVKLKKMGVVKGISDIFIPIPSMGYSGFWIEMKSTKGKLSKEQRIFMLNMRRFGYRTETCYSCEDAIITIEWYLKDYLNSLPKLHS